MKRKNTLRFASAGLALAVIGLAGCSGGEGDGTAASATSEAEQPAATEADPVAAETTTRGVFAGSDALWNSDAALGEPVASFGDGPLWTETTHGAANKGTTGKAASIVGEVVDVSCYMQLGKRGEAHIPCGTDCVTNGAPIGLVDADNELYVVMAEEHDPRRHGNVALKAALTPFMAKTVRVVGMLTERDGVKTLYVLGYTTGPNPNQPKGE